MKARIMRFGKAEFEPVERRATPFFTCVDDIEAGQYGFHKNVGSNLCAAHVFEVR